MTVANSSVAEQLLETATVADRRYIDHRWLSRFAWFTAFATLLLICSGGMVTSKGYGLAVPDWPTTFGYNMFLFPVSKWIGGILFEHTHRLLASAVGLLTIVLAIWLWRKEERAWVRPLGIIAVGAVILQGVLGGIRVTMLKDEIGIFHACLAQGFLALLVFIALVTTRFWHGLTNANPGLSNTRSRRGSVTKFVMAVTMIIYVQLGLGATMRHQHRDLSILDFPTANGAWIPNTGADALVRINAWRDAQALSNVTAFQIWLQMVHRFVAVAILIGVIMATSRVVKAIRVPAVRRLSVMWVIVLFTQIFLGAWTIWSNKAADVATAHVAVGAVMLSLGVTLSTVCWRLETSS